MKNRVKNLLNSLINQYEQLLDVSFNEDLPTAANRIAELKLKRHISQLETSMKQLINMRDPIYTYEGIESYWAREAFILHVKKIADGKPDARFDDEWERIAFIECINKLTDGQLEPRFAKILDAYTEPVENYYKLVEDIERKNVEFKRRTTNFLMCCSDY